MNFLLKFILVLAAMVIIDFCWAKYTAALASKARQAASLWSATIVGWSAFAVVNYAHDYRLIVAAVIGAYIGTYFAIKPEQEADSRG